MIPFTGLVLRRFTKLVTALRRTGVDATRRGWPWSLPLADRALLVTACWRTNLTMRQLAPLFGISKYPICCRPHHRPPRSAPGTAGSAPLRQRSRVHRGPHLGAHPRPHDC
ncbi:transposase family protein [Streptomyces sp. NPDC006514]|uniref:transposase family protein n=1 Tax=Streptomyces sp. NPDC006514 TaxID=3154308 RepID=UPI0033BF87CF